MKKSKTLNTILSVILFAGLFQACRKDEKPAPNPCAGYKPVKAGFETGRFDGPSTTDEFFPDDTFLCRENGGGVVYFNSKVENATQWYWQIGSDPKIHTGKIIDLSFDKPYGQIRVNHWVTYKPNTACEPLDDGADTTSGNIYLVVGNPWQGSFEGYDTTNPSRLFTIRFETAKGPAQLYNFPDGCQKEVEPFTSVFPYKWFSINNYRATQTPQGYDWDPCYIRQGVAILDPNNRDRLIITYKTHVLRDGKEVWENRKFIGMKVK